MSAYQLLVRAIERKSQSVDEFTKKANTFYAFNQLTESEYGDLMTRIAEIDNVD